MKKRSAIIVAIILMSIGFAAVSTSLIINGNAKVSENEEDFSVTFTAASLDGKDVYSSVVDETKKIITFETSELKTLNQTSVLTYEVTNNSSNYDAEVRVTCVPKDVTTAKYTSIKNKLENDVTIVKAKNSVNGTLTITLDKTSTEEISEEYTCKLEFNAVERESIGYNGSTKWTFDYTGEEQTFIAPITGTYKLEVWGAQGGSYDGTYKGGYGSYSNGTLIINANETIYINVGGEGVNSIGGYNGGADVASEGTGKSGGGATHIAKVSGLLSTLENYKNDILIVSGGGGGAANRTSGYGDGDGGSAGGYIGNTGVSINHTNGYGYGYGTGGSQIAGGSIIWTNGSYVMSDQQISGSVAIFGRGSISSSYAAGGGGGFYGGGSSFHGGAGGGSGYIGNDNLTNKAMYCYNCEESTEESTKTFSTTCTSATATENCAKQGNGYARITLIK